MNAPVNISIPKSCPEKWDSMSSLAKGHFCCLCRKEVIDFTRFTEKELQHYFLTRQNQVTCGRFFSSQLEVQPRYIAEAGIWAKVRNKLLAAAVFAFPFTLKASSHFPAQRYVVELTPTTNRPQAGPVTEKQSLPNDSLKTIYGIVLDSVEKATLPAANISIKGTNIKTTTDAKGNFRISYDAKLKPILVVRYTGYQTFEQEIRIEPGKTFTVMLTELKTTMGEVCIRRPGVFNRLLKPLKK
jgi:hypothetical protein